MLFMKDNTEILHTYPRLDRLRRIPLRPVVGRAAVDLIAARYSVGTDEVLLRGSHGDGTHTFLIPKPGHTLVVKADSRGIVQEELGRRPF